ncbi:hypothetical protein GCM10010245_90310 [Streptomyces spectabilis]|nr:hypothetical protein GCM10010245_90310 [Streptomyces spectabilis]
MIWDNLNVHKDASLRTFIDARDWITSSCMPPYTPNLNPVEGIRSLLRRNCQANTAFSDHDQLPATLHPNLRQLQHRSNLIDTAPPQSNPHTQQHADNLSRPGGTGTVHRITGAPPSRWARGRFGICRHAELPSGLILNGVVSLSRSTPP